MYNSPSRGRRPSSFSGRPSSGGGYRSGGARTSRRGPAKQTINPSLFVKKGLEVAAEIYKPKHRFEDFDLHPKIKKNIIHKGYEVPSPIQDQTIPHILEGRDLIGIANTGTGKTAAFALPLIDRLRNDPSAKALIVAPTRELAQQISEDIHTFAYGMGIYDTIIIGGASMGKQISQLARNPQVIIGTPGRLKDLIERGNLKLDQARYVVLDEVDRMVDMGFIKDITMILSQLPSERQSLFFTATITPQVETILQRFSHDAVKVSVKKGDTAASIDQDVIYVGQGEDKRDKLHELLSRAEIEKALVFGETKWGVEKLAKALEERGHKVVTIHGNKSQGQRQRALKQFKDGHASVMLATDVAARGLDINDITHVINYDQPNSYDDYVHRIGRAGRAGRKGQAYTFI